MPNLDRMLSSVAIAAAAILGDAALASVHLMQIEQVIGGVDGDTTAQAIQLRMRSNLQNQLQGSKVWAWDATGSNPVLLVDPATSVPNSAGGSRILLASAGFQSHLDGPLAPDFTLTSTIPVSYLAAGSITFENNAGTQIYWRFSWGGAAYTGSNTGAITNDADGDFGPPFPAPCPSAGVEAALFQGPFNAMSTTNLADYALTGDASTWTNNAGATAALVPAACPGDADGNSSVDFQDLLVVLSAWGPCGDCATCPADFDCSGHVDFQDLLVLLAAWGDCP